MTLSSASSIPGPATSQQRAPRHSASPPTRISPASFAPISKTKQYRHIDAAAIKKARKTRQTGDAEISTPTSSFRCRQQIEHTGKIESASASLAMNIVQVARQRTERHAAVGGQCALDCQTEVLEHQINAKTTGIIMRGWHRVHYPGARVVHFQGPVTTGTLGHDLRQDLGIHAVGNTEA